MIVAIHQPQYLPWLGYFHKMDRADMFCYLDNVQFKKNEWQNRNRIKTSTGWQWITVPVHYRFPQKINEITINTAMNWGQKHLQSLRTSYGRAPFFKHYISDFEAFYSREWTSFADMTIGLNAHIRMLLNLQKKPVARASDYRLDDDPTGRLIDICRKTGADTYLAGQDGAEYMDMDRFKAGGIQVIFQKFHHPVYPQMFGEFQSHLSAVDLLFNCGPGSIDVIRKFNPLE